MGALDAVAPTGAACPRTCDGANFIAVPVNPSRVCSSDGRAALRLPASQPKRGTKKGKKRFQKVSLHSFSAQRTASWSSCSRPHNPSATAHEHETLVHIMREEERKRATAEARTIKGPAFRTKTSLTSIIADEVRRQQLKERLEHHRLRKEKREAYARDLATYRDRTLQLRAVAADIAKDAAKAAEPHHQNRRPAEQKSTTGRKPRTTERPRPESGASALASAADKAHGDGGDGGALSSFANTHGPAGVAAVSAATQHAKQPPRACPPPETTEVGRSDGDTGNPRRRSRRRPSPHERTLADYLP